MEDVSSVWLAQSILFMLIAVRRSTEVKSLGQWEGQGVYIKSSVEVQTYNCCSTSFWAFSASIKGVNRSSWRNETWVFIFVLAALQVFRLTLDTCFHVTAWALWTDNFMSCSWTTLPRVNCYHSEGSLISRYLPSIYLQPLVCKHVACYKVNLSLKHFLTFKNFLLTATC